MDQKINTYAINTYAQDVNLTEPYHHILKFQQPRHLSLLQICATCECKKKYDKAPKGGQCSI